MSTTTSITAAQLLEMPDDGKRYELVAGELKTMSPSGWKQGEICSKMDRLVGNHVEKHDLGTVFGAETGFFIARSPDTVRAPDVAFVAKENLPTTDPADAYWPGAPDLAVEVLSPNDKTGDVDEKIHLWLAAGSRAVWVVDPKLKTVTVHQSTTDIRVLTIVDELDGGAVVPGLRCQVADIFGGSVSD